MPVLEASDRKTSAFAQKIQQPRHLLGMAGPFQVVDLIIPIAITYTTKVPLLWTVVGQTAVHYKLGIETFLTSLLLPPVLFPRT